MRQKNITSLFSAIALMFAFLFSGSAVAQNANVFGFDDGYKNNADLTKNDDGSWTIATTGSDPYVATSRLMKDLAETETSLTFEYKADTLANLEVFFSTEAGNKYATGNSYKLGDAPAAEEWTRVTIDITKARTKWGWGKAGHTLRLDVGTAAGINFQIRDLRACADAPAKLEGFTMKDGAIQINSQEDFDKWVAGFNTFITATMIGDVNVDLNADVTATSKTGSVIPTYAGVFNGNGNKITLDVTYVVKGTEGLSLFHGLSGTVKNLELDGTITGNNKFMASVTAETFADAVIDGVTSNVTLLSLVSGDGTHGGLVGRTSGMTTIRNCVFAGRMDGETTSMCGGLVGWFNASTIMENCLMVADINVQHTSGNTIGRNPGYMKGTNLYANSTVDQTPASCTIVTPQQLESGEVCFALNGDQKNIAWYQNIGEDAIPVLDNTHKQVYASGEFTCNGTLVGEGTFTNDVVENTLPEHSYSCGVCDSCGHVIPNFVTQDAEGFYIIDTPEKLVYIANFATANPKTNIRITADLDMVGVTEKYTPITNNYSGIFDGGGHTISNLVIIRPTTTNQALIGTAGNCTVKNLTLDETCYIEGAGYTAGFVGQTNGAVTILLEGLVMKGNVVANGINAAGIWGCNMGNTAKAHIKNCAVTGFIKGQDQTSAFSGYAGTGYKTVMENCWFMADNLEGVYQNKQDEIFVRPGGDAVKYINCYSSLGSNSNPETGEDRYVELTPEMAESGELAYRLNGNQSEIAWYQTLGEDALPTLNKTHKQVFFSGETACNGELLTDGDFSNDGENNVADHEYTDGVCEHCGAEEPGFAAVEMDQFGFYLIDTADKFAYIAKKASKDPTINIRITEDLDFGEISEYYEPIVGAYAGTIDGGGHIISNFIIDRPDVQMQALIGLAGACTIKNLTMDATCNIVGAGYSAGFVGETTGTGTITFENVYMHGNVTCNGANGAAIYACNMGSSMTVVMTNCGVTGNVYGGREAGSLSGWLGADKATLTNCWSTGTVEAPRGQDTYFVAPVGVKFNNCWSAYGSRSGVGQISEDAPQTGELTWKLNGSKFTDVTWYQNLDEGDAYPTLDKTRGIVYKTEEGYATLIEGDAESVENFINTFAAVSKSYVEDEEVQTYANKALFEEYVALVDAYENVTDIASFMEVYTPEQAMYAEVKASVAAYKNYEAAMLAMKEQLAGRDDFSGPDREFLEETYLGDDEVAPGEYEAAPNGNFTYIMENRVLTPAELTAEIAHANELLRVAVANGFEAGTDITNLLVNANFADNFNGWKGSVYSLIIGSNVEGSTMRAAEAFSMKNYDMYQELVVAKGGVYELQVRGGTRVNNDWHSTQLSPYFYLNGNANYLQAVREGAIPVDEAIDGVNAHLTGSIADLPIRNDEGDTIAWVPQGPLGASIAFDAGRYDNRLVINVNAGDTLRIGIKQDYFGNVYNDWSCIGDIHLIYQGALEESEEAINRSAESMIARANTLLATEVKDDGDYGKYPNWSQALKDQVAATIEKLQNGDVTAKYAAIVEMSNLFKEAVECKKAYRSYFARNEEMFDAVISAEVIDPSLSEMAKQAADVFTQAGKAYTDGSISTQEAKDYIYINTIPVFVTPDENGIYHIGNTAQMYGFSKMVNAGTNNIDAVLDGDVMFETAMIMNDFYGTFDGQGHTMNVNIEISGKEGAAPFFNLRGATVKNLTVTGEITSDNKFAAAIAAHAYDASTIENIQSYVNIHGTKAGDGTHGGILAVNNTGAGKVINCLVAGTMDGTASMNGGIIGFGAEAATIINSLIIANITWDPNSSNIMGRNQVKAENSYFLTPYGGTMAGATQVTDEQLMDGSIAMALNKGKSHLSVAWRQDLGADTYPVVDPTHKIVYKKADGTYTNEVQNEIQKHEGSEADPYIISTAADMALLREFMVPGRVNYVQLGADIDMSEVTTWTPLNMGGDVANGIDYQNLIDFDGKGHVISNFTCTDATTSYNSFFGILNGSVRNVGFKDAVVACEKSGTGILAGYVGHDQYKNEDATKATSRIENVWVSGKITGSNGYIGGFFGTVAGPTVMKNCYSNVEIVSDATYVGGIAGRVRDQFHLDQAYSAGSITTTKTDNTVGGIIGGAQQAATSPSYYNNVVVWNGQSEFGPTIEAQNVTLPTADLLDVVFTEEGIADQSAAQMNVEVIGTPQVVYNEELKQNVMMTEADVETPVSYLKVDYAGNQAFMDNLADGFTFETTFALRSETIPGDITPFRATESGGFGIDLLASGQIKAVVRTELEGVGAYRYANTSAYVKPNLYYHVVGVYNKATNEVACYVNGGNAATGTAVGNFQFPANDDSHWLGIGADCGGTSATDGGDFEIVNARIYSEPMTEVMAKALYFKQTGRDFYAGDKVNNISFFDGSNFATLQNTVVSWGSPWKCDMTEGTYPTFDGTLSDGINNIESIAKGKIFNINGIQVEKTTKGLYIIDGKKVMVK